MKLFLYMPVFVDRMRRVMFAALAMLCSATGTVCHFWLDVGALFLLLGMIADNPPVLFVIGAHATIRVPSKFI